MSTLFRRIGGDAAVDAAVVRFDEVVLADGRIRHFFDGVDLARQTLRQKRFLKYAFGGTPNYPGQAMRKAHAHLTLGDGHFDAVLDDLGGALRDLGVGDAMIGEVSAIAETTRGDVLNRAA